MTDHSFDKFIKDKLNNYESPVPDGLWERIQQEKDRKPSGMWWKKYGFYTFIGAVAILLTGTILLEHNKTKETSLSKAADFEQTSQVTVQSSDKKNNKLTNSPEQVSTTQSSNLADVSHQLAKADNKMLEDKDPVTPTSPVSKSTISNLLNGRGDDPRQPGSTLRLAYKRSASLQNPFYKASDSKNKNVINNNLPEENYFNSFSKPVFVATAQTDKNLNSLLNNNLFKDRKDFKLFTVDCPSARGPVKNDFYIELYGSPDYARKTINNASTANPAFLQRKDSTESMRLSYTAGFRFTKTIGENLIIKAGLQYSQINEKFSYRNENERKVTTVITIRTVIRSAGDTVMVRDTSTVEQIGYRVKTTYNRYRSIDLPLLLGYEWGNDNLRFAASGGVILNLYSWQKGESLDTSFVPVAFNKNTGQTFKQNIGLGVYAGISVLKKVSERSELFMEPYFRYNISNMTNNKSLFNQKFQVAGINLGIRYKLNGSRQH